MTGRLTLGLDVQKAFMKALQHILSGRESAASTLYQRCKFLDCERKEDYFIKTHTRGWIHTSCVNVKNMALLQLKAPLCSSSI